MGIERSSIGSIPLSEATDVAIRVLAIGPDRESRIESRERTTAFLSSLCPEL